MNTSGHQETSRLHFPGSSLLTNSIVSLMHEGIILVDFCRPDLPVVYCNQAFSDMTGYAADEVLGMSLMFFMASQPDGDMASELKRSVRDGMNFTALMLSRRKNGDCFWGDLCVAPIDHAGGLISYLMVEVRDVTVSKCAQEALQEREALYMALVSSLSEGVVVQDEKGVILACNQAAADLLGPSMGQIRGLSPADACAFIHEDGSPVLAETLPARVALQTGQAQSHAILGLKRPDDTVAWISVSSQPLRHTGGKLPHAVVSSVVDITKQKLAGDQAYHLAYYDALTGLPNRSLLKDRVEQCIEVANRHHCGFGMLFLDMDNFKKVNDLFGHHAGDALLCAVAQRLREVVRGEDSVCRLAGDEFVILLPEAESVPDVMAVAEKLKEAFIQPFHVDGHSVAATLSIGASLFPSDGQTLDTLLAAADTAMYYAKGRGSNNYQFFQADMRSAKISRKQLECDLREALQKDLLTLHYQPRVQLADGNIREVAAQVRWKHPLQGWIEPATLLAVAESGGLDQQLEAWVLETAVRQNRVWLDQGLRITVAVHAPTSLIHTGFEQRIGRLLELHELPPELLQIGVSEAAGWQKSWEVECCVDALGRRGVKIAIDDVLGLGGSLLNQLQHRGACLQLDIAVIKDLDRNPHSADMVSAIMALANNSGLRVTAEGVDSLSQLELLQQKGCHAIQGGLVCPPVSADELTALLQRIGKQPNAERWPGLRINATN